jgi:thiol:disulfide interchange protein
MSTAKLEMCFFLHWLCRVLTPLTVLLVVSASAAQDQPNQKKSSFLSSNGTSISVPQPPILANPVGAQFFNAHWRSPTQLAVTLQLNLAQGHKIYAPKVAGDTLFLPTQITPKTANLTVNADWPAGQLCQEYGMVSHVYRDSVSIPLMLTFGSPPDLNHGPVSLAVKGMVCATGCQPLNLELSLPLPPLSASALETQAPWQWIKNLFSAFLGGLILNVMPCVLPVLGLKLKGFVAVGQAAFRQGCVFSALGILSTFFLMGGTLAVLKEGLGAHIEWGMHLKNPFFCIGLALIMVASAYSFLGLFHLSAPRWALELAGRMGRRGGLGSALGPEARSGVAGSSFGAGILAVLLATPCSAPFLAPVLALVLTGNWLEILGIHMAIGIGFAFPYLLGLVLPVYKILPKPGRWMIVGERLVAYGLLAASGWLVAYPLSAHLSPHGHLWSMIIWGLLLGIGLVLSKGLLRRRPLLFASALLAAGLCVLPLVGSAPTGVSMQDGTITWKPFSQQALTDAIAQNKVVLVDVTGVACTTCAVNKRVFFAPAIQKALLAPNVVCLRADYSHPSPEISGFLQNHNRATYPFNAFFSKTHPGGHALSEWLTQKEVLRGLALVQKKAPQEPHSNQEK